MNLFFLLYFVNGDVLAGCSSGWHCQSPATISLKLGCGEFLYYDANGLPICKELSSNTQLSCDGSCFWGSEITTLCVYCEPVPQVISGGCCVKDADPTPPPCSVSSPSSPVLISPDGKVYPMYRSSNAIVFEFNEPSTWGQCSDCSCSKTYDIRIRDTLDMNVVTIASNIPRTGTSEAYAWDEVGYNLQPGHTYQWSVLAKNSERNTSSSWKTFKVGGRFRGYTWDATDVANCSGADLQYKIDNEIQKTNLEAGYPIPLQPTIEHVDGDHSPYKIWDPDVGGFTGSYIVTAIPYVTNDKEPFGPDGGEILCLDLPNSLAKEEYRLRCADSANIIPGTDCFQKDKENGNEEVHLGYERIPTISNNAWFQVIGGDIYGGKISYPSIDIETPGSANVLGGFSPTVVSVPGGIFIQHSANISSATNDPQFPWTDSTGISNKWWARRLYDDTAGEYTVDYWPKGFSVEPASDTTPITDCANIFNGTLSPGISYSADFSCFQSGLDNVSSTYTLSGSGEGVATVYVSNDGSTIPLDISNNIRTDGNSRILLISDADVKYSSSLGDDAVGPTTESHVEMGVITSGKITFEGDGSRTENTLIAEGPVVSSNPTFAVQFERDRGVNNGYPATVIKYNPYYIESMTGNGIRPEITDIKWVLE